MLGRTIGKYRFVDTLGRGGMGTVYKAVDETLDREVAVKVLNAELLESDGVKRFRAEAVTLAKLNHPRIAHVYDLARDGDTLLMVMEFVQGDTFEKLVSRSGALPVDHAVALVVQALEALQHAHASGIVHRDLKPANLMLTPSGDVKVMDFGIARVQGAEHLTSSGYMMGTPAYMAPEQVRGEPVDARTDVYAMGVVLYRMVTGQLPFKADTAVAMIQKQLNEAPTPSRQFRADIPSWLDDILHRTLTKDPATRFQTADEFRLALLQQTSPDQFLPTMPPTPTPTAVRVPTVAATGGSREGQPLMAAIDGSRGGQPLMAATDGSRGGQPLMAAADGSPSGQTTVTLQKSHLAGAAAIIGLLIVAVGALAFFVLRRPDPAPATTIADGSSPAPRAAPAPSAATATAPPSSPAPAGNTASSPRTAAPAPGVSPATPRPPASFAPPPASTITAAPAPQPADPLPSSPVPTHPPAPGTVRDTPIAFKDIKLVLPDGNDKLKEHDVVLKLEEGRVWAVSGRNPAVNKSMPYRSIVSATYSRSKHPRWKEGIGVAVAAGVFSAPIFFMKSTKHWLTLQSRDDYFVLHLDKDNVNAILPLLETRAGVNVQRLEGDK